MALRLTGAHLQTGERVRSVGIVLLQDASLPGGMRVGLKCKRTLALLCLTGIHLHTEESEEEVVGDGLR